MKHIALSFILPFMFFCSCGNNTTKSEMKLADTIFFVLMFILLGVI